ncbi:MAG: hypothetical protein AABY53_08070 [Bdellovibrionota bacterium]
MDKKSLIDRVLLYLYQVKHWVYFVLIFCIAIGVWSIFFEDAKKNVQLSEIHKAEMRALNRLSVSSTQKNLTAKRLPARFEDNPAFKLFVYIDELMNRPDQAVDGSVVRKIASDPATEKK